MSNDDNEKNKSWFKNPLNILLLILVIFVISISLFFILYPEAKKYVDRDMAYR